MSMATSALLMPVRGVAAVSSGLREIKEAFGLMMQVRHNHCEQDFDKCHCPVTIGIVADPQTPS